MEQVLLLPLVLIGLLSVAVLIKLVGLSFRHRVRLGLLLNMFFRGLPIGFLCRIKDRLAEDGIAVELEDVLHLYFDALANGATSAAEQERRIRKSLLEPPENGEVEEGASDRHER